MKTRFLLITLFCTPLLAQVDLGWRHLAANRYEEARTAFAASDETNAQIGWFLTHTGRGPTPELAEAGLTILRKDPASEASEFVLKWMMPLRECLPSWVEQAGALCEGVETTNPELRNVYGSNARLRARYRAARPDFPAITRASGVITDWKVSPIYGAYPLAEYRRDWPPEQTDGWSEAVDHSAPSGVVLPPRQANGPGVYYAASRFESPVAQDVIMRAFSYQNITVWVDGARWIVAPNLERLSGNIQFVRGKLPAGTHEVVVKVTQLSGNNGQFSVQLTADQPLTLSPAAVPTIDLTDVTAPVEPVEVGLAAALAGDDSELAELIRAVLHEKDRDTEPALARLETLAEAHPESQLIGGLLAEIYLTGVPYKPQQDQLSQAFQILSTLARAESEHNLENRFNLGLLLARAQQTRPALDLINAVTQANPHYCGALEARLLMAEQESLLDLRRDTLDQIEDLGPSNHWGQTTLLKEARDDDDLEKTRAVLENLARLLPWDGYVAQINNMDENYTASIEDLTRRWELFPDRDFYPYSIAEAYARLGDHEAQRTWLERTLDTNPEHRESILDLVNLDLFEGRREDARRRLINYLRLEPGDAFFRQRLSHLEGRSAFEAFRVPAEQVIEDAKGKPMSEGADSELLLDQLMVRLFPDGSQMRYTHLVTRVLTKKGVDEESELPLRNNLEILNLRTIKQDGSVLFPESFEEKSTISMAGVGVGDFIDEEHIEYLPPAGYDADGLDADMTFIFQGLDRIYHHSELVLIYPADLETEPELLSRHMPIEPTIEERDGLIYVRWLTTDMPPLPNEPGMASRMHFQPTVSFYYNTTWSEIRDFYFSSITPRMGLSREVLDEVDAWRASDETARERAETVYRAIVDRIEPGGSIYTNVNLVWATNKGNATLLLDAVYDALGYTSDIVFVQSREGEEIMMEIPMPSHAYTLIRLQLEDETVWLDPNQQNLAFGYVPHPFRGVRGLICDPDELFTTVPEFDDASERVETEYKLYFADDGSLEGAGTERFHGLFASQMVRNYAALNRPEIRQRVEAGINITYPGAEIKRVAIEEDLPPGTFALNHDFSHPGLATRDGARLVLSFPLPETPLLERYGALPKRTTPIRIDQPYYNVATLELHAPKGLAWDGEDRFILLEDELGRYELTLEHETERKLIMKRTYYLKSGMIEPDAYPEFLAFCKAMVENEDMTLTASKDGGTP